MKLVAAAGALTLTAALAAVAPASADPDPDPGVGTLEGRLPGQDLAGIERSTPTVRQGQVDKSKNIELVAHRPFTGPFDQESIGSDLAFKGDYAFAGNFEGFVVYDISKPEKPKRVANYECLGPQNDMSVYGDLLVLGVDSVMKSKGCNSDFGDATKATSWEGVRVFDISKPRKPRLVKSVRTACGSHTQTLAPSQSGKTLYVYVSSYFPSADTPNCQPPHDSISVVKVPVERPGKSRVVATPNLFPGGGSTGEKYSFETTGCHDITAYPEKDIAAGACMGDGVMLDISDRDRPRVIDRVRDNRNFNFWHSATFNNSGTTVVFTDELGGGVGATCNKEVGPKRGANGIYKVVGRNLEFRSYYKIRRPQSDTENCVAHNGSLIPVKGRDIMVQAWYQGGTSVFDFSKPRNPRELAHFDRGAVSDTELTLAGSWSSYWYNGYIYSSDITRGLEVFELKTPWARKAAKVEMSEFNPQTQPSFNG